MIQEVKPTGQGAKSAARQPANTLCPRSHIFGFTRVIHSERIIRANTRSRERLLNKVRANSSSDNGDYSISVNRVLKKYLIDDRPPRTHLLLSKRHGVS
jgi:hypothetical protein